MDANGNTSLTRRSRLPSTSMDQWTQDRLSVDFGAQYPLAEPRSVYPDLENPTNTALKFTEGGREIRVIQRELYGLSLQAGVSGRSGCGWAAGREARGPGD